MKKNLFLAGIFWSIFACGVACAHTSVLYGIRTGLQAKGITRIVLDLEEQIPIEIKNGPSSTLTLQLPVTVSSRFIKKNQSTSIQHIRVVPSETHLSITFTCRHPYRVQQEFFIPKNGIVPTRYVIDLAPSSSESTSLSSPIPPPGPSGHFPVPIQKKTIVIDAGHGGRDSGSRGMGSVFEKSITLTIAKRLAHKLNATGQYTCILTRSRDEGMTLAQRLRTVRNANGDLFLSIHADSCSHPDTRGLSIYTLSQVASDREAARLAQKENKADLNLGIDFKNELPEISDILIDLTKRETMNLSTRIAKELLKELSRNVFLLRRPHRFADFVVLRSPHVPSILIELGFLSNARDNKLLNDPDYQDKICDSMVRGINLHFQKLT